jgi:hypothetical protein
MTSISMDARAIWHEAAHSVVALRFDFPAADILWENGNFKCTHTGRPGISLRHVYIVLAAGAAAEELEFGGNYNPRGSSADSASISKFGGARIEDYLLEATEILAARRQELESIVKELQKKWQGSIFTGRPNPFKVMSAEEIDAIHNSFLSQYAPAI